MGGAPGATLVGNSPTRHCPLGFRRVVLLVVFTRAWNDRDVAKPLVHRKNDLPQTHRSSEKEMHKPQWHGKREVLLVYASGGKPNSESVWDGARYASMCVWVCLGLGMWVCRCGNVGVCVCVCVGVGSVSILWQTYSWKPLRRRLSCLRPEGVR